MTPRREVLRPAKPVRSTPSAPSDAAHAALYSSAAHATPSHPDRKSNLSCGAFECMRYGGQESEQNFPGVVGSGSARHVCTNSLTETVWPGVLPKAYMDKVETDVSAHQGRCSTPEQDLPAEGTRRQRHLKLIFQTVSFKTSPFPLIYIGCQTNTNTLFTYRQNNFKK
jgi:hypothetical protein